MSRFKVMTLLSSIFLVVVLFNNCSDDVAFMSAADDVREASISDEQELEILPGETTSPDEPLVAHAVFKSKIEAELYMGMVEPPTPERILAAWPRSTNDSFYSDPTQASGGNVQSWYYDNVRDSFVMPVNSPSLEQIFSPMKLDSYEFEATLTSDTNDDDFIGLVVAADHVEGELLSVVVGVQPGGGQMRFGEDKEHLNFSMVFIDGTTIFPKNHHTYATLVDGNNSIEGNSGPNGENNVHGWNGRKVKIKVVREGSIVSAIISDWDGNEYMPSSQLVADLSQLPGRGKALSQPSRYGFASLSQPDSTYLNYSLKSRQAFDLTRVYAAEENLFWRFIDGNWELQDQTASSHISPSQKIFNPLTKEHFNATAQALSFDKNLGISEGEVTLALQSDRVTDLSFQSVLNSFNYKKQLFFGNTYKDDKLISEQVADKLRIVTNQENGSFYVLLRTQASVNQHGIRDETIAFRKVNVRVE